MCYRRFAADDLLSERHKISHYICRTFLLDAQIVHDDMEEDVPAQVAGHTNLASLMSCDQREEAFGFLLDAKKKQEQRAEFIQGNAKVMFEIVYCQK